MFVSVILLKYLIVSQNKSLYQTIGKMIEIGIAVLSDNKILIGIADHNFYNDRDRDRDLFSRSTNTLLTEYPRLSEHLCAQFPEEYSDKWTEIMLIGLSFVYIFVCLFVCSELIEELVRVEIWHVYVKCANLEEVLRSKRYLH